MVIELLIVEYMMWNMKYDVIVRRRFIYSIYFKQLLTFWFYCDFGTLIPFSSKAWIFANIEN